MDAPVEPAGRRTPLLGRVIGALVFLVFLVLGLVMAAYFFREAWANYATRSWTRTDCTILESSAPAPQAGRDHPSPSIRYEYRWQGRTLTSTQIHRQPSTFRDYRDVQRLLDRYPANTVAVCFVNPAEPEIAILEHESSWQFLLIAFPLVFAGIGGVGAYAILFGQRSGRKAASGNPPDTANADPAGDATSTPISSRANHSSKSGAGCLFVFFLVFGGLGAGIFVAVFIRPWLQSREAASWTRTPCTVLASDVRSHRSDDGTTYSIEILYEYRVNGRPYRSNRYTFSQASSSGRDAKAAVVRQHPPGLQTFCYVNPRDATDAVLVRELSGESWIALIPLAFALIGVAGMTYAVRLHRRSRTQPVPLRSGEEATTTAATTAAAAARLRGGFGQRHAAPGGAPPNDVNDDNGPDEQVELRAGSSRVGKVVAALLVGAFWNGIVSVFVYQVVQSARRGAFEWFLAIFLIPFVVIGLVILGFFFHSLLGLFAPRPVLTLGSARLRPGASTSVSWLINGRVEVIEQLRVYLEGREEATYRRGTSTSTDRHVFAEIPIATIEDVAALRSGEGRLTLPLDLVPSFASANNKIVWTLRVRGRIRRFPDIDDSFPIEIQPRRTP